ncbi:MAG TPA: DUF2024 family protein [Nitrososphaera sp.]|nr:DUF2024 family protein [Nitrososphaera sp.]
MITSNELATVTRQLDRTQFCHIQEAPPFVEKSIKRSGYWIQKMEGCPALPFFVLKLLPSEPYSFTPNIFYNGHG